MDMLFVDPFRRDFSIQREAPVGLMGGFPSGFRSYPRKRWWVKMNSPGDRRLQLKLPFTRVPFWVHMLLLGWTFRL